MSLFLTNYELAKKLKKFANFPLLPFLPIYTSEWLMMNVCRISALECTEVFNLDESHLENSKSDETKECCSNLDIIVCICICDIFFLLLLLMTNKNVETVQFMLKHINYRTILFTKWYSLHQSAALTKKHMSLFIHMINTIYCYDIVN